MAHNRCNAAVTLEDTAMAHNRCNAAVTLERMVHGGGVMQAAERVAVRSRASAHRAVVAGACMPPVVVLARDCEAETPSYQVLRSILGLCLFLFLLQSVRLLRFLRLFGRTTRALSRATKEVASIGLLFFVLMAIFAQVGHLLFSHHQTFSTFGASLAALAGALIGSYSLADIG